MTDDLYKGFAERYDWMKQKNPPREQFFRQLFAKHNVSTVLDCACGTGCDVHGSDLSDSMLAQARKNIAEANVDISIKKADYRNLDKHYKSHFDAVVCLSNSINEAIEDTEALRGLRCMKSVLKKGGILVLDQGQSDATMRNPPKFAPVINNRDFSRLFVMEYLGKKMKVNIFDFIHTKDLCDFKYSSVYVRIRLKDDWDKLLNKVGFAKVEYYGGWDFTIYNKKSSKRLIIVVQK